MTRSYRSRGLALLAAATALLTACSGTPADTGSSEGVTIAAAEFPWSAAKLTNAILAEVVAQHPDLGVSTIEPTGLGPAPAWAGAQRGDIDLLTEVALPNQQQLADQAANRVSLVHQTYGGAAQGWFVPTYATQPGQPLAGLTSVTQLGQYADALGGRLVDADPSFITTTQNAKRIAGYGLPLQQVTSSEAAQLAELRRAYERQEPILVYLYHPHWVFAEFDMTQLQEPTPFQPGCFDEGGSGACAMPDYSAWTAASTDLQQEAPRFYALLQRFELPLPDVETMLRSIDVDGEPAEDVAKRWVDANPQVVQQWLAS
ncbi:glycine betaine/proline transport system substrate-binding protein [Pseudonocardia hierapolitana]|uniref:Glycine betaine/proline transport system substrate-binding protein n=1 Tax=Pseudonocardia hierapolitana TaxID=1128676 RepID=A0A561SYA4_9PSEU|nr:glycine betaine ABC transporter substrate-binding protein [Pseudonocardia hierapolitana]TWF79821.1 glycine betaine/proline transport system substrate-binding protein [Pseudonocardia hierapolitana]